MQESRDRASSDGRAPLVASLLESARTKGRKMLCASPDHQLVHVQAAVCGPQNRQYQTSGTTCRIRGEEKRRKNLAVESRSTWIIRNRNNRHLAKPQDINHAPKYQSCHELWIAAKPVEVLSWKGDLPLRVDDMTHRGNLRHTRQTLEDTSEIVYLRGVWRLTYPGFTTCAAILETADTLEGETVLTKSELPLLAYSSACPEGPERRRRGGVNPMLSAV